MGYSNREQVLHLDDPANPVTTVTVRFQGMLVPLSKERLLELLRREQAYLLGEHAGPPVAAAGPEPTLPVRAHPPEPSLITPVGSINHAGLSIRIKRVHAYCRSLQALRPAHAEHLAIILGQFDWQIPEHPNSQLDTHLKEIEGWDGVDRSLRQTIRDFVARYASARLNRSA